MPITTSVALSRNTVVTVSCFIIVIIIDVLEAFNNIMDFDPSQTSRCFTLVPIDDDAIEAPSTLTLSISSDDEVSFLSLGDATLTVDDNDRKP